jgi:hypothetical protein
MSRAPVPDLLALDLADAAVPVSEAGGSRSCPVTT